MGVRRSGRTRVPGNCIVLRANCVEVEPSAVKNLGEGYLVAAECYRRRTSRYVDRVLPTEILN